MNTHMIAVFNFIVTVGGAFMFAYKATEYTLGSSPNVFAIVSIIIPLMNFVLIIVKVNH